MFTWLWRCILLLVSLSAISAAGIYFHLTKPILLEESTSFKLDAGATSATIGAHLTDNGWIINPILVKIAFKLNPQWVPKVGKYHIEPDMSLLSVLALFDSGKAIQYQVTLIEGKTTQDYLKAMADKGNIKMTLLGESNRDIATKLALGVKHAEGQFFANTYTYAEGDTDRSILLQANKKLAQVLDRYWQEHDKKLPYKNVQESLIMASIVEKETGAQVERPLIAGVFINRLNLNMRLQTDPTVIYGLGSSYDGNIRRKHLKQNTPYNTYRIYGLPPTPIANVGEAAIEAALNPQKTKALYFVARGDGTHVFSNTLKQHNAAVAKYQRFQRRKDYQSKPSQ
ncbi:predicted periplasmic solute-binding protein [Marinomonas sp. MED121]|uniref:endolytic transglycosylase MltG n=1 Tax=Marinomonas sp. MED121 TaxID=314277 RepID=UPI0000690143|nr:endolytic transglycosylase MltG [Marinomonas sp. MED121]EAQ63289.1 predicted periplasmic solute-binding protein [Marinomonas sp. MED121]